LLLRTCFQELTFKNSLSRTHFQELAFDNFNWTLLGKLLVTTGTSDEGSVRSEVLDLLDASNHCQDLDDYPIQVVHTVGGLLNDTDPMVCGAVTNGTMTNATVVTNECYIVGQSKL
jgi:hypothetical protein